MPAACSYQLRFGVAGVVAAWQLTLGLTGSSGVASLAEAQVPNRAPPGQAPADVSANGGDGPRRHGALAIGPLRARSEGGEHRFALLAPETTGVEMVHRLDLDHPLKRLYHAGFACGGAAIGDVNGDGAPDLFFTSGNSSNRLFLQRGDLEFVDATTQAGVDGGDAWGAGAALGDIDNDGDLDLLVCNYESPCQLFVNDGKGRFVETAAEAGLDLVDACLAPSFCDYDLDGDLDVFILTNRSYRAGGRPRRPPIVMRNGRPVILPEFDRYYAVTQTGDKSYSVDIVGRPDYLLRNDD
ncbi:MAG: VCBS repeat-containing protein, partial [Planctomycetota bacterium]